MKDKLKQIQQKALSAFQDAREIKDVDDLKVKFLGKKGELTAILKEMGKLSAEERPVIGQMANEVRQSIEKMLEESKKRLEAAELAHRLEAEKIDVTMPGKERPEGHKQMCIRDSFGTGQRDILNKILDIRCNGCIFFHPRHRYVHEINSPFFY